MPSLQDLISSEDYMPTLQVIQSYSHCYPYMNTKTLITYLSDTWTLLCEQTEISKNMTERKLAILQSDNKAEPDTLRATKEEQMKCIGKFRAKILFEVVSMWMVK